jgi:N-methylhydantoinase B
VREFEFLAPAQLSLLTERRLHAPWGASGGSCAEPGRNTLNGETLLPKVALHVDAGDRLRIETAGGGGWGRSEK